MKRIKLITLLVIFVTCNVMAQFQMALPTLTADKNATVLVPVTLTNSATVTAMQFELNFPTTFEYVGIELSARKVDHTVLASVVAAGRLRVIIYSGSQTAFTGTSGAVVNISLKTGIDPIVNAINLSNVVLSNEQGTSLTATTTAGSITINGPKAEIGSNAIDFGRVVNSSTGNATITIYNRGNQSFNIESATSTDSHFTVGTTLPLTVSANSSKMLAVAFNNSTGDFDFTGDLNILTSDPVTERASFKVSMKGSSYSLNTLQIGAVSGKTGTEIRVPITVNNQVPLSAMQLDITLPDSAKYIDGSLTKGTAVPAAFQMSASQTANRLKILFYTNDNSLVPASNAEFCAFKIKMNNYNSNYPLSASQVILANTVGKNVMSSSTNGSITLTAPHLSMVSSIGFGNLNVGVSVYEKTFTVSNIGNEPLIITAFNFPTTTFKLKSVTLPLTLAANQSTTLTMQLTDVDPGVKSSIMTVISNEKLTEFKVNLSAVIIANFELAVLNISAQAGNNTQLDFNIKNDLNVTAIQFDMAIPPEIPLNTISLLPTNRISDWSFANNKLASGVYRILTYSPTNTAITGNDGIVFSLPFQLPSNLSSGQYNLILSNVIIANASGVNVVTKTTNAVITVSAITENVEPEIFNPISMSQEGVMVVLNKQALIQLLDMNGRVIYTKKSVSGNEFIPLKNNFIGIVKATTITSTYSMKILK